MSYGFTFPTMYSTMDLDQGEVVLSWYQSYYTPRLLFFNSLDCRYFCLYLDFISNIYPMDQSVSSSSTTDIPLDQVSIKMVEMMVLSELKFLMGNIKSIMNTHLTSEN